MVPSVSVPEPWSVTVTPEVAVCAAPAFAVGDRLVPPPLLELPPPPPPQADRRRAAMPASASPTLKGRMTSLYPPRLLCIVLIVTYGS
jgi:hypothetical protein